MKLLCWVIVGVCLTGIAFGQNDGRATAHVFPQVADGRFEDGSYYRSALHVSNPSSTNSGTCAVEFRGITTTLHDVEGRTVTAGAFSIAMGGNSWGVFRTAGTALFQSGYATLSCTVPVNAVLIYSYYAANRTKMSEAAVFSAPPGTLLQVISDQRDGARLGIAITNDTDFVATTTITASNTLGQAVGTQTVTIPNRSQYVRFLDELLTGLPKEHMGQVIVRSSGPQLAMIGLRYTGSAFTTIPSSVRQSSALELPTISSISPSSIAAGSTVTVTIAGKNFVNGATTVLVSGSGINITGVQVLSTTSASAVLAVSGAATAGTRSLTVNTPAGTSNTTNLSVSSGAPAKLFNQTQTERLTGAWLFSYNIASTSLSRTYRLSDVQPNASAPGEWAIFGDDELGDTVIGGYMASVGKFALLDTSNTIDRFFVFDFTGANTVGGCYYETPSGATSLGSCYSMDGTRTSSSALTQASMISGTVGQAMPEAKEFPRSSSDADALIDAREDLRHEASRN